MLRTLRLISLVIAFAVVGAVAGRAASEARRRLDEDGDVVIDPTTLEVRPRDVVPGLLAALRSADRPWSYLHVPAWLIAFVVNFAFAAFSRELGPVRRAAGLDAFDLFGGGEASDSQHPADAADEEPALLHATAEPEARGTAGSGGRFTAFSG